MSNNRGAQISGASSRRATKVFTAAPYLWVLSLEFALRHPSGA